MQTFLTSVELAKALGQTSNGVRKRAAREGWPYRTARGKGRGGSFKEYELEALPLEIREKLMGGIVERYPFIFNKAGQISSIQNALATSNSLNHPKVKRRLLVVQEATQTPIGYERSEWIEKVGEKYSISRQNIYKLLKKFENGGIRGLERRRCDRGKARKWSPEAVDFWIGLFLKREHRKISKKGLYRVLISEAGKRGWHIG